VTSADAAAFQDIQNVLGRRFPLAKLILSPTLVQGQDAPAQIVKALQRLDDSQQVDVILLIRGGGSIEDLWAFNDEQVARAIFATRTPLVSGIGHETDYTIADFVADYRAPTPPLRQRSSPQTSKTCNWRWPNGVRCCGKAPKHATEPTPNS
jgi:exodeoxyribonuclease VII large subunit